MYNEKFNASIAKGVASFEQRGPVVNLGHSPLQGLRLKVLLHETVLKKPWLQACAGRPKGAVLTYCNIKDKYLIGQSMFHLMRER